MELDIDVRIQEGPVRAIMFPGLAANEVLIPGACVLYGWNAKEPTGTGTGWVKLYTGDTRIHEPLVASLSEIYEPPAASGIYCPQGLKAIWVTGVLDITLFAALVKP